MKKRAPQSGATARRPRPLARILGRLAGILGALAVLVTSFAPPASAHPDEEGILQLSSVPVGAYLVSVWSYPAVARAGEFHFDVRVTDFARSAPAGNCKVLLTAERLENAGAAQSTRAEPMRSGDDLVYEGRLRLTEAGMYRIEVTILDEAGEAGRAAFELYVGSVWAYKLLTLIFGVSAVPIAAWLAYEGLAVWRRRSLLQEK